MSELEEAAAVVNGLRGFHVGDLVIFNAFPSHVGVVTALVELDYGVMHPFGMHPVQAKREGLRASFGSDASEASPYTYKREGPLSEFRHAD